MTSFLAVLSRCVQGDFSCSTQFKTSEDDVFIMYRKKGVLLLYKVFLRYPEALRPAFPRLKEKLEDPDPGVQVLTFVWLNQIYKFLF